MSLDESNLPVAILANGNGHHPGGNPPPGNPSGSPGDPIKIEAGDKVHITRFAGPARDIRPDRKNEDIQRLADNMLQHGQLTPVLAFLRADGKFEIIDGYTRYLAALLRGIDSLYVRVLEVEPEYTEKLAMQLIGNDLHTGMKPLEKAAVYSEFFARGLNQAKIASLFNTSEGDIARVLSIHRNASPELREAVVNGLVAPKAAYFLSRTSHEQQKQLMTEGIAGNWTTQIYESRVKEARAGKRTKSYPVTVKRDGATATFPGDWTAERVMEWCAALLKSAKELVTLKQPTNHFGNILKS